MNKNKIFLTLAILFLAIGAVWVGRKVSVPEKAPTPDTRNTARARGNPKGDVWIVEYIDYQCLNCALSATVLDRYLLMYPDRIYLQMRFHPLVKTHLYALKSALYADCAAKQKNFWSFHHELLSKQDQWSKSVNPDGEFRRLAKTSGLNLKLLDACAEDPRTKLNILEEKEQGLELGVKATPTFFINGKMIVGKEAMEKELKDYFSRKPKI